MVNKKIGLGVLVMVLVFGAVMTGCATMSRTNDGTFSSIEVPAKDFTSLGLVFSEGVVDNNKGVVYTYYALLKKAKELGADAIVNVTIDVQSEGTSFFGLIFNPKETWYGSATAIKYTAGTLKEVTTNNTDGTTVTKEGIVMSKSKSGKGGGSGLGDIFSQMFKK